MHQTQKIERVRLSVLLSRVLRLKPAKTDYVDLGNNWINIEANWTEAYELITVDGHATSAELTSDNRIQANFASRQLLMVDIDDGMTIAELLEHPFYNAYGAGFYATHSFTPEQHKFRICFVLETAETNSNRCRKIIRALLQIFPQGDKACVDPVRLFYGNPDCAIKEFKENLLADAIVEALIEEIDKQDAETAARMANAAELAPLTQPQRRRILELLKQTYVGNYPIWRNVGWGLRAGGFTLPDFQYVTTGMMSQKSAEDAAKVWSSGGQVGKPVTMGSVVFLLKQQHGENCLKEREDWRDKRTELYNKYK
jgi:hypothetical protein